MSYKTLTLLISTLFCLLAGPSLVHAEGKQLEIISLKHRSAVEVIQVIQPFLDESDTVSASGNKLIIRTTTEHLKNVRKILKEIDVAPRSLMITVKQVLEGEMSRDNTSAAGGRVTVKTTRTGSRDKTVPVQRIQVIEGEPALIEVGQAVPVVTESGRDSTKIEYKKIVSGFRAIAEIHGDQAVVDLMPYSNAPGTGGSIQIQQSSTLIRGAIGEWLDAGGGATTVSETTNNRRVYRSSSRSEQARRIMIKVEILNN